jgi:Bacterial Ig-like domain (group 3)/Carboxypeptidase regulatory-like domain
MRSWRPARTLKAAQVSGAGLFMRFVLLLVAVALFLGFASSALAAEEHGYITGKVTAAATGTPIAGVKVCAIGVNGRNSGGCATTDAKGEYIASVSEDGSYDMRFTAPTGSGYVERSYYDDKYSEAEQEAVIVVVGYTTSNIDAQLPEGGQIIGTVTNAETKAPVAEVEVCGGPAACVLTNAQGEYAISGLPGGEYQVSFGFGYGGGLGETYVAPEYYKNNVFPTFADEPTKVVVPAGGVAAGINQEMQEFSRISGRVINSITKAPVAGVTVRAYAEREQEGETNSNGEYVLTHLADRSEEYYLEFSAPGGSNYFSQPYGGRFIGERGNPIHLALGKDAFGIDTELEEGGKIAGRMISAASKRPIAGVNVCSHPLVGGEYKCTWTDSSGEYAIELLETGEYRVEFNTSDVGYISQVYNGKATASEATPVLVTLGHGISGLDAELEPEPPLKLTWVGNGRYARWSSTENWAGEIAPGSESTISELNFPFPALTSCLYQCGRSENDLTGLTVESLHIDDSENYKISGEPFTLERGLSASPTAATSEATLATIANPIDIGVTEVWSIAGLGPEHAGENALLLDGELRGDGGGELTVDMEKGGTLYFGADNDLGIVNFDGSNPAQPGILNGVVGLSDKRLNAGDAKPVNLNHVSLVGAGSTGALRSVGSELDVTTDEHEGAEAGTLAADSVELDAQSALELEVTGSGPNAGLEWSDLYSSGPVALGSASLGVRVAPPKTGEPCPTLLPNRSYVLVSASGTLSGSFGNAPEGSEIQVEFAEACKKVAQKLRIEYHRSGATQTVTGTVIGGPESSTTLSVLPSNPITNGVVTLTATVKANSETPSGIVEFKNGADAIPNCTRVTLMPTDIATGTGTATCTTVFAASESLVQLSALYSPYSGADLEGSASPTDDLEVGTGPTTTTLRVSEGAVATGGSVTLTASVHPLSGGGGPSRPSGSVEFLDEGTPIGACESQPLSAGALDANCHLTYTVAGMHGIIATYSGDDNFTGSSSSALSVTGPATVRATPIITTMGTTSPTLGTIPAYGTSEVILANTSITMQSGGEATIKLACAGAGTCSGKLALTVVSAVEDTGHATAAKGGKTEKRRLKTTTIGTATFSIPAGKSATVRLALNSAGRALLKADHGTLNASVTIVESSAGHTSTRHESVRLVLQSARFSAQRPRRPNKRLR